MADSAQAVAYAAKQGARSSIAVIDTTTGQLWTAGSTKANFSAASVSKVFVAIQLLATGQMTPKNSAVAWQMITRSDNAARDKLLPLVGYGHDLGFVERRYRIHIGIEPSPIDWTGDTQISAPGMAKLYAAVKADKKVFPWLYNAMRHANPRAAGGVPQFFGIPAARPAGGFAIKQGWFVDDYHGHPIAELNSTGYVDHAHYVVVILSQAAPAQYAGVASGRLGRTISHEAQILMPHGRI